LQLHSVFQCEASRLGEEQHYCMVQDQVRSRVDERTESGFEGGNGRAGSEGKGGRG